jgi:hypothetical protein
MYLTFIDYQEAYHQNSIHPVRILIPTKLVQFVEVTMENTMSCVKTEASWGLLPGEAMLESRDMLSPVPFNLVLESYRLTTNMSTSTQIVSCVKN